MWSISTQEGVNRSRWAALPGRHYKGFSLTAPAALVGMPLGPRPAWDAVRCHRWGSHPEQRVEPHARMREAGRAETTELWSWCTGLNRLSLDLFHGKKIKPLLCLNRFPAAQTNIDWLHGCSRGWRLPTRISLSGQCPCRPAAVR